MGNEYTVNLVGDRKMLVLGELNERPISIEEVRGGSE